MAETNLAEFSTESLTDISNYLLLAKYGATAFVGFAPEPPISFLKHARGFGLQNQILENQVLKYFSKNRIDTRTRDNEGEKVYRGVTGTFLLAKLPSPKAYLFLTKDSGEFIKDGLSRLLYRVRKNVSRLHLTSGEMKGIVSALVLETSGRLVVRRSILRNKRQETTVSYETEFLDALYSKAASDDAHVHSFAFKLYDKGSKKLLLNAGINRKGRFSYYEGDLRLFALSLIGRAAQLVKKKEDLLQHRDRSERTGEIKPIRITFDEPVFDKPDGVRAFLATLGKIRHGEFTIFHRNPYLHVSFFDFFDASEFEVFADSAESLVIVPQYGSTSPSLFRFCQKVFENFQEGTIAEDTATVRIAVK